MQLGMEVGLGPGDFVLDRDPAPPPQKKTGHSPQFLTRAYCAQMAGWIKVPLGTVVGLDQGHILLDGATSFRLPKRGTSPQFSVHIYCDQRVAHLSYC